MKKRNNEKIVYEKIEIDENTAEPKIVDVPIKNANLIKLFSYNYLVIFSCFTLWSITWREDSSFLTSSSDIPISTIITIT